MNITQKLVAQVKRENKKSLHPQSWHDFMNQPEVVAVNFALSAMKITDPADVVDEAKKYLDTMENA
jgi:hypothetical protein